jgi:hypothetical protein
VGLTTPHHKKMFVFTKYFKAPRSWTDFLALPEQLKKDMGFGTWNVRSKLDLRKVGIDRLNWIRLAQDRVQWWAFVNMVMKLRVP